MRYKSASETISGKAYWQRKFSSGQNLFIKSNGGVKSLP